jgi:hypothetical protein
MNLSNLPRDNNNDPEDRDLYGDYRSLSSYSQGIESDTQQIKIANNEYIIKLGSEIATKANRIIGEIDDLKKKIKSEKDSKRESCSQYEYNQPFSLPCRIIIAKSRNLFEQFGRFINIRMDFLQTTQDDNLFVRPNILAKEQKEEMKKQGVDADLNELALKNMVYILALSKEIPNMIIPNNLKSCIDLMMILVEKLLDLFIVMYQCSMAWSKTDHNLGEKELKDLFTLLDSIEHHASYLLTLENFFVKYTNEADPLVRDKDNKIIPTDKNKNHVLWEKWRQGRTNAKQTVWLASTKNKRQDAVAVDVDAIRLDLDDKEGSSSKSSLCVIS